MLAIGLGMLAGRTYLSLDESGSVIPWSESFAFAALAAVASVAVAGLTVLAANPRIRPEHVRAE